MLFLNVVSSYQIIKKHIFGQKPILKILTKSLESLYCQECSDVSQCQSISTLDMVFGGDHG